MIIPRSQEIIGILIKKDEKAKRLYTKACYYQNTKEFGDSVYQYNLNRGACEIDMGSGINNPNIRWKGFAELDKEEPYDNEA